MESGLTKPPALIGTGAARGVTSLQQVLRKCHSRQELLRTARQLGYRLTRADLQNAWLEHHNAAEPQEVDQASNY